MWTNLAIEKASDKNTNLTQDGLPPLKDALIRYMNLSSNIIGYDAQTKNKIFARQFKDKVFQTMTLEENMRLLNLGFILNLNQPALERLEVYIVKQFAAEKESLMQNDSLLS